MSDESERIKQLESVILNMQNEINSIKANQIRLDKKYKPCLDAAQQILNSMTSIENKAESIRKTFNEKITGMKRALKWLAVFNEKRKRLFYNLGKDLDYYD